MDTHLPGEVPLLAFRCAGNAGNGSHLRIFKSQCIEKDRPDEQEGRDLHQISEVGTRIATIPVKSANSLGTTVERSEG